MKYRYRISNTKLLLSLAVQKYTYKINQDAILASDNLISIVKCFFRSDYSMKTIYGTGVISNEVSPKMKLFLVNEKLKRTTKHGLVEMFAVKWPGKKPPSRNRLSYKSLKVGVDDLKVTISRLFKAISEMMIRMAM